MTNPGRIDELFAATLVGNYEDDAPWDAVIALQRIGSREVFEKAAEWCESQDVLVRTRGLDVLAQLGKTSQHPTNAFPEESFDIESRLLLREKDERALSSAIAAISHLDDPRAIPLIIEFSQHPDSQVRYHVACALGHFSNDEQSTKALLELTDDVDEDVRDWATFGLGVQGDLDTAEIRDAFVRRLSDTFRDAREEAMVGLAKRRDLRVLQSLIRALEEAKLSDCVVEAAFLMLGLDGEQEGWTGEDYAAALRKQFDEQFRQSI